MDLQQPDEDTMVRVAADRIHDTYPGLDHLQVEHRVRELVHDLCVHARVKTFVGIIAERRARRELRERLTA